MTAKEYAEEVISEETLRSNLEVQLARDYMEAADLLIRANECLKHTEYRETMVMDLNQLLQRQGFL